MFDLFFFVFMDGFGSEGSLSSTDRFTSIVDPSTEGNVRRNETLEVAGFLEERPRHRWMDGSENRRAIRARDCPGDGVARQPRCVYPATVPVFVGEATDCSRAGRFPSGTWRCSCYFAGLEDKRRSPILVGRDPVGSSVKRTESDRGDARQPSDLSRPARRG